MISTQTNSPIVYDWDLAWTFRKLQHPGLNHQLITVISNSQSVAARHCAIQIADACGGVGLQEVLTTLALTDTKAMMLRIGAASCVADHGDDTQKLRLVPLATQTSLDEEGERLQVQGLLAAWPEHCTWIQIRESLGSTDYSTTTSVGRFIAFDFAERLPLKDLPNVLSWLAERDFTPRKLSAWTAAADRLLTRGATTELEHPAVRSGIVGVLFSRISNHFILFSESIAFSEEDSEYWPANARTVIAAELLSRLVATRQPANIVLDGVNPLLTGDDVHFAVDQWEVASEPEQVAWQRTIELIVDWNNDKESSVVLERVRGTTELWNALEKRKEFVRSLSESRRLEQLASEATMLEMRRERTQCIHELLVQSELETRHLPQLLHTMTFPLDKDYSANSLRPRLEDLPGWQVLSDAERDRLLVVGKRFLKEERSSIFRQVRGGPNLRSAVSYSVLRELALIDPMLLDDAILNKWASVAILCQCDRSDNEWSDSDGLLLQVLATKAETSVVQTIGILVGIGREHYVERQVVRMLNLISSTALEDTLFSKLIQRKLRLDIYVTTIRMLAERRHTQTRELVQMSSTKVLAASESELPYLAADAGAWMAYDLATAWIHV